MRDSERYRRNAADCLDAAHKAHQPHYKRLYLLIAQSWLTLADQDDRTDELLASWNVALPVNADGIVVPFPTSPRPPPCQQSQSVGELIREQRSGPQSL
jgi:hypothetical protein